MTNFKCILSVGLSASGRGGVRKMNKSQSLPRIPGWSLGLTGLVSWNSWPMGEARVRRSSLESAWYITWIPRTSRCVCDAVHAKLAAAQVKRYKLARAIKLESMLGASRGALHSCSLLALAHRIRKLMTLLPFVSGWASSWYRRSLPGPELRP